MTRQKWFMNSKKVKKMLFLGECTWLCYGSGEDSSGDMPTERVKLLENVLKIMLPAILSR